MTDNGAKKVIEAEVVSQPSGFNYKEKYTTYTSQTRGLSKSAWFFGLLSLPLALLPIFGFIFALFALVWSIIKKVPPILPIISLVISGFITSIFLLVAWFFRLIFN